VSIGGLAVVKVGGELLETPARLEVVVRALAEVSTQGPLVVVHGGGREIDAEMTRRGVEKQAVDGLRITDAQTLEAVIAVLAGTVNTRLVAGLVARGVKAVGLTGVDAALGRAERVPAHDAVDGRVVDLGLVGAPDPEADGSLLIDLVALGYVPVVASLGIDADGQVLNVNADTLAAHVAVLTHAKRLVVAGGTAGVLDGDGRTIPTLTVDEAHALMQDGTVSAGMVAKLQAATSALDAGVDNVLIVDGRHRASLRDLVGTKVSG
jgi:acetylglutamate kinase